MSLAFVPSWAWLPIYALAAFRLTRMWTADSLPPLPWVRQYVLTHWGHKAWSELMTCPWCAGVWWSFGVVILSASPIAPAWQWVALPLAVSAVAGGLASLTNER